MEIKKRKKSSRHRGSHTHGRGAKKKARGKGHRGGVGKAGTGKRADQKKTLVLKKYGNKYFGKDKALRKNIKKEVKIISLENIVDNLDSFVKKGVAKENKGIYEFDLRAYKVIGNNEVNVKLRIVAKAVSKGARDAVKKAGGEVITS
ncbi:MAG: uL15 family ribosomal protein [Nanoarchaeota archaeon]|nr:uL15 family ribosomal protein [Nanoarchaeota archaeon]